jgi:hypothetical protein
MKHELMQGQYAAFLSLLTPRARAARDITRASGYADGNASQGFRAVWSRASE